MKQEVYRPSYLQADEVFPRWWTKLITNYKEELVTCEVFVCGHCGQQFKLREKLDYIVRSKCPICNTINAYKPLDLLMVNL